MATIQTQPAQGGTPTKPAPSKDQGASAAQQGEGQPVFRDWAAI